MSYDGKGEVAPVTLRCNDQVVTIHATALTPPKLDPGEALEDERRVTMPALAAKFGADWEVIPDLGSQHGALRARLSLPSRSTAEQGTPAHLVLRHHDRGGREFAYRRVADPSARPAHGLRAAVKLDDGGWQMVDFATVGRSDQWRQNV